MILRPATFEEAARLLGELSPGARPLAGGTDLVPRLCDGRPAPEHWVDLSRIGGEARAVRLVGGRLAIGALVDFETLSRSALLGQVLPALRRAAGLMGSAQIRCRATLGGNLCNASPAGDAIPPLLVADAAVRLLSGRGERTLPLASFLLGPGATALAPGELLVGIEVPVVPDLRSAFERVGARAHHVITKASAALACRVQDGRLLDVRLALGAVAPTVVRAPAAEAALEGRAPDPQAIARAGEAAAAAARPIDDVRSTAAYRREACRALVGMLVEELVRAR